MNDLRKKSQLFTKNLLDSEQEIINLKNQIEILKIQIRSTKASKEIQKLKSQNLIVNGSDSQEVIDFKNRLDHTRAILYDLSESDSNLQIELSRQLKDYWVDREGQKSSYQFINLLEV